MSDSLFGFDKGWNMDTSSGASLGSEFASISPILSTFGAINSAIGTYYQSQAQANNLRFQADMAKINSQIGETNAQAVLLSGQRAEQNARMRTSQLKSRQRVSMAANGVDLGSKSAVDILTSTDYMGEVDAETIQSNAIRAAFGYRTQSMNDRNTALLANTSADNISPIGNAAGSLLGSSGAVAESWYKYAKRSG